MRRIDVLAPLAWFGATIFAFVMLGWIGGTAFAAFNALVFWCEWRDIRQEQR